MVSSTTRKIISLAISLLVVVISLTGVALGATAPTVATLTRYTPGFAGAPGKMARDAAGNFYVTDFWGKGIVKLDSQGVKIGFIATNGRPSAVAVLPDNRLVVAVVAPQPKVAFYVQLGVSPNGSGEEDTVNTFGAPTVALYRPVAITTDATGKIYVLDSGDNSGDKNGFGVILTPASIYRGNVKVYGPTGAFLHEFGERTYPLFNSTVAGEFKLPHGIAYEKAANQIVVVDTQNGRLQYFTVSNGSSSSHVKSVGTTAGLANPTVGASVMFANPVDVAFEYNDSNVLQRVYVAEKGKNQVTVFDPVTNYYLMGISGIAAPPATTVSGASMNQPSSVLFERTGTGSSTAGVLYVSNAATATAANILSLGVDGGTVPAQTVTMTMLPVPSVSPTSPITVSGTTTPATDVVCSVNGGAFSPAGNGNWGVDLPLASNSNNYIFCKSTSGGAYRDAYTYYGTPSTTTTIAITEPSTGLYTKNAYVNVKGTTIPGNATVQLVNSLGGTEFVQSDTSGNWSKVVNLAEGNNEITVNASKPGTNTSADASVTVIGDFTPPNMTGTISFIADGSTTTSAVQNLDGIVLEANLQSITVNGVTVPAATKVTTGNNTYFSIPVTLVRDSNLVTVAATDLAGNSTTLSRSVTLAPEKPGFTVDLPADNKFRTAVGAESASGTIDPTFTSVSACGTSVSPVAGSWSASTPSIDTGFVSCQFTASGGGNITVNEKRTFNTNGTYGLVAITSPATDIATNTFSVTISGSVAIGAATPQISINGAAALNVTTYDSGTGAFSHVVSPLVEGLNSVKIISNTTTAIRNIVRDTIIPELVIRADSASAPVAISGSIEPSAKMTAINASLDGVALIIPVSKITFDPYNQSGSVTWRADLSGYVYDTISFSSVDPAGNLITLPYKKGVPTGDVDGDGVVRLADALAALRHVAGTEVIIDPTKFFNGDVGGLIDGRVARNGVIDITDSVLILNKAYGLMAF